MVLFWGVFIIRVLSFGVYIKGLVILSKLL